MLYAADAWAPAVETYRNNLPHRVEKVELNENSDLPSADVIVGGPPCQGFSSAGTRRHDDPRNSLVSVFAQLVARARPTAFVFENVEGFLTASGGDRVFELLEPLLEAGYCIHLRKVNAANYGVPQHRKRVIAIGGLGWEPVFPQPTHSAHGAPGATRAASRHLPKTHGLLEALRGLASPAPAPPGNPEDHFARPLESDALDRVRALRQGMTMKDLPSELWHASYKRRAFRRVMDGTPTERRGGAPAGLRRLRGDEPSKAITSGARSEFIHPIEHRTLTLRECARLQTFPDAFRFTGTQADKAVLIGNAIPPLLAVAIGEGLVAGLDARSNRRASGALLSFVPTVAEGASPVLARLVASVEKRFGVLNSQLTLVEL